MSLPSVLRRRNHHRGKVSVFFKSSRAVDHFLLVCTFPSFVPMFRSRACRKRVNMRPRDIVRGFRVRSGQTSTELVGVGGAFRGEVRRTAVAGAAERAGVAGEVGLVRV